MPWSGNLFAFTPGTIARLAPAAPGIYVLWKRNRWVGVGVTEDVRRQLQRLAAGENDRVRNQAPTEFGFEVIAVVEQRNARHQALIRELEPTCC
jgi:hypothetical protein